MCGNEEPFEGIVRPQARFRGSAVRESGSTLPRKLLGEASVRKRPTMGQASDRPRPSPGGVDLRQSRRPVRSGGVTFGRMDQPDEQRPSVKKQVSRPLMLLFALLIFLVFTLIGLIGQDKTLGEALRAALVPFAVAATLAFLVPWINDHLNNG
jgi:hypothetical protein